MSKEITVTARSLAIAGKEKELEAALRAVTDPTHAEAGCLLYAVHREKGNPLSFLIVERWASIEDHQAHMVTAHVQELFKKVPGLVSAPTEIKVFESVPMGQAKKGTL